MQLLEEICNYESNTNQCIRKIRLERLFAESPLDKSRLSCKFFCPFPKNLFSKRKGLLSAGTGQQALSFLKERNALVKKAF